MVPIITNKLSLKKSYIIKRYDQRQGRPVSTKSIIAKSTRNNMKIIDQLCNKIITIINNKMIYLIVWNYIGYKKSSLFKIS